MDGGMSPFWVVPQHGRHMVCGYAKSHVRSPRLPISIRTIRQRIPVIAATRNAVRTGSTPSNSRRIATVSKGSRMLGSIVRFRACLTLAIGFVGYRSWRMAWRKVAPKTSRIFAFVPLALSSDFNHTSGPFFSVSVVKDPT
jgi:hypothetical protein